MSLTETILINRAVDPSQTTVLRNAFAKATKLRFRKLQKSLFEVIVEDNGFGLTANRRPGQGGFNFPRMADKVGSFMKWLQQEIQDVILQVTQPDQVGSGVDRSWTNFYIQDSYKRAIIRARVQMKLITPSLEATGGVGVSLLNPFHVDRLGLLYTRTFNELKGVTDAMAQQISRILTEGISKGLSPKAISRQLNQVITGIGEDLSVTDSLGRFIPAERRAEMVVRTEIIRAYAEAQLQEFQNWGVKGVSIKAELLTTQDQRTCSKCLALEKQVMTIEEARGIIPVHPGCRCIWIPFIEKR